MPAPASSLLLADHVVVRLRESVYLRGRLMTKHGQHGSLVALSHADALRLIEAGQCKPLGGVSMREMKEHLEEPRPLLLSGAQGGSHDATQLENA